MRTKHNGKNEPPSNRHHPLAVFPASRSKTVVMRMMGILMIVMLLPSVYSQGSSRGVPSAGQNGRPDYLENVTIEMVNDTTAQVSWNQLESTDNVKYQVEIQCHRQMECCNSCNHRIPTNETYVLFRVDGATSYSVNVSGYEDSDTTKRFPLGSANLTTNANTPNMPAVSLVKGKTSLSFNWNYACPYTGPVRYVFGVEGQQSEEIKTDDKKGQCNYHFTTEDNQLKPFTKYKYSLLAVNDGCTAGTCGNLFYPLEEEEKDLYTTTISDGDESISYDDTTTENPSDDTSEATGDTELSTAEMENTELATTDNYSNASLWTDSSSSQVPTTTTKPNEPEGIISCSVCYTDEAMTRPDVPGPPVIQEYILPSFKGPNEGARRMRIGWSDPNDTNGIVEKYQLRLRQEGSNDFFCEISEDNHKDGVCFCRFQNKQCYIPLDINSVYELELKAKNRGVDGFGPPASETIITESGWPLIDSDPYKPLAKSKLHLYYLYKYFPIQVNWNAFNGEIGPITLYEIILMKGKGKRGNMAYRKSDGRGRRDEQVVFSYSDKPTDTIFVFGESRGRNCEGEKEPCNDYLEPSTHYRFRFRVHSGKKYTETETYSFETQANVVKSIVIGLVVTFLLLCIILIAGIIIYKRYFSSIVTKGESMELPLLVPTSLDDSVSKPIPVSDIPVRVDNLMADDQALLKMEYQDLKLSSPSKPSVVANDGINPSKNRYVNILPFDETRVILNEYRGIPNSDYINASYIHGYDKPKEFIACQGPREKEKDDFWRMIWEKNVHVIVMVTKFVEARGEKCCRYWPDYSESKPLFLPLSNLSIKTEQQIANRSGGCIYSTITVTKKSVIPKSRTVKHFHYTMWPDMGCPKEPDHLISFVKLVKKAIPENNSHIVVHCSAGVGRTGTFIALYNLVEEMKVKESVDIYQTVYRMRQNRANMVQTLVQYAFIYKCVQRYVQTRDEPQCIQMDDIILTDDIPDVVNTTFSALNANDEKDDPYNQNSTTKTHITNPDGSPQQGDIVLEPMTDEDEDIILSAYDEPEMTRVPYMDEEDQNMPEVNDVKFVNG